METRREFLAHSTALVAGLSVVPGFRPADSVSRRTSARLAAHNEVPRVLYELHIFRHKLLPILISSRTPYFADASQRGIFGYAGLPIRGLDQFQACTDGLLESIRSLYPLTVDHADRDRVGDIAEVCGEWHGDTSWQPDNPSYELIAGWRPIRWRIDLFDMRKEQESVARVMLSLFDGPVDGLSDPWGELTRRWPDVRQRFLAWPATFNPLAGIYYGGLPLLADLDPTFVVDALDFERLKASMRRPPENVPVGFVADAVGCGAAFVATALANNHFPHIGRLLEKPDVNGYWAGQMPGYLLSVLHRKVVVLRELAGID